VILGEEAFFEKQELVLGAGAVVDAGAVVVERELPGMEVDLPFRRCRLRECQVAGFACATVKRLG